MEKRLALIEEIFSWSRQPANRRKAIFFVLLLVGLNFFVWGRIWTAIKQRDNLEIYSLAVGQGDSELVKLPGGAKILIDGGPPNGLLLTALDKVLAPQDRYLDLMMISHPQLDHFGGLVEALRRYQVGLILTNGEESDQAAFQELKKIASEKGVDFLPLAQGDEISYLNSRGDILSPAKSGKVIDPNDDALVFLVSSNNLSALFTGDIPAAIERRVIGFLKQPIDVLKVAHHGSKYSSSDDFLAAARPKISLIEVGKNSYGHPTPATLKKLADIGSLVYRTDLDGTVKLASDGRKIEVFKEGLTF